MDEKSRGNIQDASSINGDCRPDDRLYPAASALDTVAAVCFFQSAQKVKGAVLAREMKMP